MTQHVQVKLKSEQDVTGVLPCGFVEGASSQCSFACVFQVSRVQHLVLVDARHPCAETAALGPDLCLQGLLLDPVHIVLVQRNVQSGHHLFSFITIPREVPAL